MKQGVIRDEVAKVATRIRQRWRGWALAIAWTLVAVVGAGLWISHELSESGLRGDSVLSALGIRSELWLGEDDS